MTAFNSRSVKRCASCERIAHWRLLAPSGSGGLKVYWGTTSAQVGVTAL